MERATVRARASSALPSRCRASSAMPTGDELPCTGSFWSANVLVRGLGRGRPRAEVPVSRVDRSVGASVTSFAAGLFTTSLPFWLLGSGQLHGFGLPLPLSALMFVCPGVVATVLAAREAGRAGVLRLWRRPPRSAVVPPRRSEARSDCRRTLRTDLTAACWPQPSAPSRWLVRHVLVAVDRHLPIDVWLTCPRTTVRLIAPPRLGSGRAPSARGGVSAGLPCRSGPARELGDAAQGAHHGVVLCLGHAGTRGIGDFQRVQS